MHLDNMGSDLLRFFSVQPDFVVESGSLPLSGKETDSSQGGIVEVTERM